LTVTSRSAPTDFAQVLVQNRVSSALSQLPQSVQTRRHRPEAVDVDPAVRDADLGEVDL